MKTKSVKRDESAVRVYGVTSYFDEVKAVDGKLTKNGKSYAFDRRGHPAYGYRTRVPVDEVCLTPEAAVKAWRVRLENEIEKLEDKIARLRERLARDVREGDAR